MRVSAERFLVVVHHRDVALVASIPERLRARRAVGHLRRVVADAGRPPDIRHRVLVARVVARVGPLGTEIDEVRQQRLVELDERPGRDETRHVDRDRERDVVAAAVLAELGVGDLDVVEQLVLDLDRVLLLERGDDVLADVVEPVVDDQLGLGRRDRRRLRRGGRGGGRGCAGRRRSALRPMPPRTAMPRRSRRRPRSARGRRPPRGSRSAR